MKKACSKLSNMKGNSNGYSTSPWNYRQSFIPCLQCDFKSYSDIGFAIAWWKNISMLQVYWKCMFSSIVQPWILFNNDRKEQMNDTNVLQVKSVIWELKWKLLFLIPCSLSSLFDHRGKPMLSHLSLPPEVVLVFVFFHPSCYRECITSTFLWNAMLCLYRKNIISNWQCSSLLWVFFSPSSWFKISSSGEFRLNILLTSTGTCSAFKQRLNLL